jgi:hypothetical protein
MITTMHSSARMRLLSNSIVVLVALVLSVTLTTTAASQTVGTVSYQGQLKNINAPMAGYVDLDVTYYYVGTGEPALTETFAGVPVTNGIFNIELGSKVGGLPGNIDLTKPLEIGLRVNGSPELSPRTQILSVPFAMNAHSLDGILASVTPANNRIFPLPVDQNGHIGYNVLPPFSINGLPATDGNIQITAGPNVTISRDINNNRILVSALSGISNINVGDGLIGGGTGGTVTIGLDVGNIPGNWILKGSITGFQMSSDFTGEGLYLAPDGALRLGADLHQFNFENNKLHLRTDAPVIGTIGEFRHLQVESDVVLNTDQDASTIVLGTLYVGGGIDAGYQRLANLGEPAQDNDAATASYVDQKVALVSSLGGDITGVINDAKIDPASDGIGDRLVAAVNGGSMQIDAPRLNIKGDATIGDDGLMTVSHALVADFAGTITGNFSGDVTGSQSATAVSKIQGVDVSSIAPSDGQFMAFDGASNSWMPATAAPGGILSINGINGITVDNSTPAMPVISMQTPRQRNLAGSIALLNTNGNTDHLSIVVTNPNVTTNSIIIATVVLDSHSNSSESYTAYVTNIVNGSFTMNLRQASGNLSNNEGATIHYAIFN